MISRAAATWRREGLSKSTIGAYLGHLRVAFGWAQRMGMITRRPQFRLPRVDEMRGRPITLDEFKLMLRTTPGEMPSTWRWWIRFQRGLWLSGLRLGEAIRLSWDTGPVQVDLDGGKYPRLKFRAAGHKARRVEFAPITPDFAAWLQRMPTAARTGPVLPLWSAIGKRRVVDSERVGCVLSAIGKLAKILVDEETGKHASAHDFRRAQ